MFNISEVTPFLFVTLQEFVFKSLDLWFHFIGIQDTHVVYSSFTLEFSDLGIEELDIVVQVDSLVVCEQLRW